MEHTERIGIRELRQNASVYVEKVKAGRSVEITQRGELVAVMSPPRLSPIEQLIAEAESAAVISLLDGLRADQVFSSALTRTELVRSVARSQSQRTGFARRRLARVSLIALSDSVLDAAAVLSPAVLRSLDAVHVASAMRLGGDLDAVLTYESRVADAARANGLTVIAPT